MLKWKFWDGLYIESICSRLGKTGHQWLMILSSICTRSKLCLLYSYTIYVYMIHIYVCNRDRTVFWLMFLIEFTQLSIFFFTCRIYEWNIVGFIIRVHFVVFGFTIEHALKFYILFILHVMNKTDYIISIFFFVFRLLLSDA